MNNEIKELLSLLERTKQESSLIIVEGYKDKKALLNLGFENKKIIVMKKPIFSITEEILKRKEELIKKGLRKEEFEIIILTDLDKEGKKLYSRLKSELQSFGLVINDTLRNFLFKKTKLRQIQGLNHYINEITHTRHSNSKYSRVKQYI